jgi:cytochrome d ubiquinol oxidase subunit I
MLGVVMVVYVLLFGSFLVVLLKMRTRWRLADEQRAPGGAAHVPEADTPYGPRAPLPAGGGAARAEDGRP